VLFNSFEFIVGFLPLALLGFFALGTLSRTWALHWLVIASLIFYASWRPMDVLIIVPAILCNFVLARALSWLSREQRGRAARAVLILGIGFNVAFLGYFKYTNFAIDIANDVLGKHLAFEAVVLPLGISFITFQKIAFLIDVHGKRVDKFSFPEYLLFVLFFPQLVAGPIVHYREMMPQFRNVACRPNAADLSAGVTLFAFGLFKKVVLADGIAPYVNSVYEHAASAPSVAFLPAWMAAVGFTLQIYFDFSGYTDMALGIARLFGIRLPPNFDSPLRASSIIDFWLRWHMTLTRFLTAYIYNPLALRATRQRLARYGAGSVTGINTPGGWAQIIVGPVLVTMLISGVWHGAGYTFLLWGLLHGFYLAVNHGWRLARPRIWSAQTYRAIVVRPIGWLLTFGCVAASMVLFRSPDADTAARLFAGMCGLHGPGLSAETLANVPWDSEATGISAIPDWLEALRPGAMMGGWILLLAGIVFALPNTLQMLRDYEPALGWKAAGRNAGLEGVIVWRASIIWACVIAPLAMYAVFRLGGPSEFLYWQF
jgi:D-alanyl-lipoteichoic acid acyltransferase DltB (MBOAT superfamily)